MTETRAAFFDINNPWRIGTAFVMYDGHECVLLDYDAKREFITVASESRANAMSLPQQMSVELWNRTMANGVYEVRPPKPNPLKSDIDVRPPEEAKRAEAVDALETLARNARPQPIQSGHCRVKATVELDKGGGWHEADELTAISRKMASREDIAYRRRNGQLVEPDLAFVLAGVIRDLADHIVCPFALIARTALFVLEQHEQPLAGCDAATGEKLLNAFTDAAEAVCKASKGGKESNAGTRAQSGPTHHD